MLTTAGRDVLLAAIRGTTYYLGLITGVSNWRAGTVTEASYTGYARVALTATTDWNAPADTAVTPSGRRITNANVEALPQNTGAGQDVIAYGIWDAASSGNLIAIVPLDDDAPVFGVAEASGDTITAPAHGLAADQRVFVLAAPGAVLPAGLSEGTAYYVRATGLTTDVFTLSTTSGGAAVNITAAGAALFIPYKAVSIATNATPQFAAGAIEIAV